MRRSRRVELVECQRQEAGITSGSTRLTRGDANLDGGRLWGVIYPSARVEGGLSYVLFFTNENCIQDDIDDDSDEKWLSMVTSSVKRIDLRARPPVKNIFRLKS